MSTEMGIVRDHSNRVIGRSMIPISLAWLDIYEIFRLWAGRYLSWIPWEELKNDCELILLAACDYMLARRSAERKVCIRY